MVLLGVGVVYSDNSQENCTNGIDDDGDGLIDCDDPDCKYPQPAGADICWEATCNDGVDNDGDYTPSGFGSWGSTGRAYYYREGSMPLNDSQLTYWDKFKIFIWGRDRALAGKASLYLQKPLSTEGWKLEEQSNNQSYILATSTTELWESPLILQINPKVLEGARLNIPGIDCGDSDCIGRPGPNGELCCFSDNTCPPGTECINRQCKEVICSDEEDNDGDGLTDCEDPDCINKICKIVEGEHWFCHAGSCIKKPEAEAAPAQIKKPVIISSYNKITSSLNRCIVRTGQGANCGQICSAGEKGFPTKTENGQITRCTCCGGTALAGAGAAVTHTASAPAGTQINPSGLRETSCTNGIDDDGDGLIDCDDPDCFDDPYC